MDSLRVTKVPGVECSRDGGRKQRRGTLHLTAHHLIFHYDESSPNNTGKNDDTATSSKAGADNAPEEMWVPYPLISLVTRTPQSLSGKAPISFQLRTFESFSLFLNSEKDCSDVFESVKELTVTTSIRQLYAFHYTPNPKFSRSDGWTIYSPRDEFGRMGLGTRTKAWRFTDINKDYSFCATYPAKMVVPTRISDTTLQYAAKYRSKCRIPALTYLHWGNFGSITRSSQPMVGITQNRSIQDEKLIEAIFQTHYSPDTRAVATGTTGGGGGHIYGATSTNLIIDARPTANAFANSAKGAGTENMDNYKEGKKAYLGIDNIHAMRESLGKVVEALREADATLAAIHLALDTDNDDNRDGGGGGGTRLAVLDRQALRRSGWLRHMTCILEGSLLIVRNVHINSSHVLIHCSDGWDRTAQLSSISQLCLDPYYRTFKGFMVLVEKDWLSFGHKFLDRCGHLSSEKFFVSAPVEASGGEAAAQAFLASVQNRLVGNSHLKETSPVFHQFLETVRQVQRQFPTRFEFNERFLRMIYYHLYSCQFGTFLSNCEKERRTSGDGSEGGPVWTRTVSVWDYLNEPAEMDKNRNVEYDSSLDDPKKRDGDMGVLFPNPRDVRFWNEVYGRGDEEMNGRVSTAATSPIVGGTLTATPTVEDESSLTPSLSTTPAQDRVTLPPSPSPGPQPSQSTRSKTLGPMQTTLSSTLSSSSGAAVASAASLPSTPSPSQSQQHVLRPSPSRAESFRPFDNTGSSFTMRTQIGNQNQSSGSSQQQQRSGVVGGVGVPEFFTSGTGKAWWGKLSSNASAALSKMQDAYEGVTKDFAGQAISAPGSPGGSARGEELKGRHDLTAWGVPVGSIARSSPSSTSGTQPSSLAPPTPTSSLRASRSAEPVAAPGLFDNPWEERGASSSSASASSLLLPSSSWSSPSGGVLADSAMKQTGVQGAKQPLSRSQSPATDAIPISGGSTASGGGGSAPIDPLGVGFK